MLERIVIESIAKRESSLEQIHRDTKLEYNFILNLLSRLVKRGLIKFREGKYSVYQNQIAWRKINRDQSISCELKELTEGLVENYFTDKTVNVLKLQKVYMTEKDLRILDSLFNNIDIFIKNLKADQRKSKSESCTSEQKVIFWSYSGYNDLIQNSMLQAS